MAVRFEHLDDGERPRKSLIWWYGWRRRIRPGVIAGFKARSRIWVICWRTTLSPTFLNVMALSPRQNAAAGRLGRIFLADIGSRSWPVTFRGNMDADWAAAICRPFLH